MAGISFGLLSVQKALHHVWQVIEMRRPLFPQEYVRVLHVVHVSG